MLRKRGAFGDGRINLRGFETENIAVMVNRGTRERDGMGWNLLSNWAGLSDVTVLFKYNED